MIEYFKLALSKYADFSGRSRRSEYWYFTLVNILISIALNVLTVVFSGISESLAMIPSLLAIVISLGLLIPGIAVAVRRLHDTGRSGWWLLIALVPLIGAIVLLVFMVQDSEPGANKWGPNPKTGATAGAASHLVD